VTDSLGAVQTQSGDRRMMSRFHRTWFVLLLMASNLAWAVDTPVKIGVLAFRPKDEMLARWQPTADYLSVRMPGKRFSVTALNYAELEQAILAKQVDLVLTNPAHCVLMTKRSGLSILGTLVVNEGGQPVESFGGVIAVRAARSDLQSGSDLRGKMVATPDQQSFGGFTMQAYELEQMGLRPLEHYRVLMTGMPHDAAFQAMLDGRADAAFVRTGLIESLVQAGKLDEGAVRVLNRQTNPGFPYVASTRLYPEWPIAALPHVDKNLARQVAALLYTLPENHPAAIAGEYVGWAIPADYESVRAVLEALRMPPFDKEPVFTTEDVVRRYGAEWAPFLLMALALMLLAILLVLVSRRLGAERQRAAVQNEERQRLLASLGEGVFGVDANYRCTFINPAALEMLGFSATEVLGANQHDMFHHRRRDGEPYPAVECPVGKTLADGKPRKVEDEWLLRKDGSGFPAALTITPIAEGGGHSGAVVVFRDLTDQKRMEAELLRLATTDFLTGLPNRRRFLEQLDLELARLRRGLAPTAALLMLDLDHFKKVNDHNGHSAGDNVLQHFSALLRESLRRVDTAGRLGGEEFAVILAGSSMENAGLYAERLREQVAATLFRSDHGPLKVTVSIGVTVLSDLDAMSGTALARADLALYRAKSGGRNRVETALAPVA
jgi:diguanylate cyclase (GGDEF)-like protein/PAS domain S-box-containing protein